jgi:hypothetical protein
LQAHGLNLNEDKSRLARSQDGFNFLGFTVRWQRARTTRRWYAPVEPSAKSRQRLREQVRQRLNHWTQHRPIAEVIGELNRRLRGWSGYFHCQHSSRVLSRLNDWTRDRLRRWLWRKQGQRKTLWTACSTADLHGRSGLWQLPQQAAWKRPLSIRIHCDEAARKAGYGKSVRPV